MNPEQAGDLLQVLRKGGSFGDFKSHVDRTQKDASLDAVIKNSIVGPKMIKDFILSTSTFTKALVVQGWGIFKLAQEGGSIFAKIAKWGFAIAAIMAIPKALRMAGAWIANRFGDKLVWLKQMGKNVGEIFGKGAKSIGPFFKQAGQVTKQLWKYLRTGSLFDHIGTFLKVAKGYLGMIPHELHNLWALFRSGAARVTATVVRGGRGAAGLAARGLRRFSKFNDPYANESVSGSGAGNSGMFGNIADALGVDLPNGEFGALGNLGYDKKSPEIAAARKRRAEYLVKLRAEERDFKKLNPGKSSRMFKLKRFASRAGGVLGPVAGNAEKSAIFGGAGGKLAAGVAIGTTLLAAAGGVDALMTDKLDTEDDEKKTAGYRKHGKEIEDKQKGIDDVSETLEYVRESHDQALIAAIEAEKKAKEAEKDALDKDSDRLNDLEKDYEQKRKTIETLKDYAKRLRKKGKDREAEALDKRIEDLKRDAGNDKSKMNAAGVSPNSENAMWGKAQSMLVGITTGFETFYGLIANWKLFANVALKIGGLGSHVLGFIAPIGKMMEGAKTVFSVVKASGAFDGLLKIGGFFVKIGKFIAKWSGILDGVTAFFSTEGGFGRKLFAGTVAGVTSFGIHRAADAVSAGSGGVLGGAAEFGAAAGGTYISNKVAAAATSNIYDKLFGNDSDIPTVTPAASSQANQSIAGSTPIGSSISNVNANGTATLVIHNFQDAIQSANSRIASDNSGMSGR